MAHHQRSLRAELAAILSVDQYSLDDLVDDPPPPTEPTSTRLSHLIIHAVHNPIEARAVYAFLPALVLRIFGYAAGQGWLETISSLPHKDRHALLTVVAPYGPVHTFCKHASSTSPDSHPVHPVHHMRFEFPAQNLPPATRRALRALSSHTPHGPTPPSFLAPLLLSRLKPRDRDTIILDPETYFLLCMIASPPNKISVSGIPEGTNPITNKRIRRSVSLPSTRALYNQLIAAYTAMHDPSERVHPSNIFIPAVLDFLFMPCALATPDATPSLSPAAADAATTIFLTLLPPTPDSLPPPPSTHDLSGPPSVFNLSNISHAAAVYALVPYVISALLNHFVPADTAASAVLAYLRLFALYIAPWRGPVRESVRKMIFPRARPINISSLSRSSSTFVVASTVAGQAGRAGRAAVGKAVVSAVAAMTGSPTSPQESLLSPTPLSCLQPHVSSSVRSPQNVSAVKDARWRAAFTNRISTLDSPLLTTAVVRAAALRIGSSPEGIRVLAVLTDAAQSARLAPSAISSSLSALSDDDGAAARRDEVALCIEALRSQQASADMKSVSKAERAFIPGLAAVLGVRVCNTGMLANLTEIVHGGAQGMKGVVNRVSGSGTSTTNTPGTLPKRRKVFDMHMSLLRLGNTGTGREVGAGELRRDEVPFFGSVWDRPIDSGELEPLVIAAYWVALKLEPLVGFLPDTRFLGRIWFWVLFLCTGVAITLARAVVSLRS